MTSFLNTSHQTVGWFADQNKLGRLTLRPPFQRRPVWMEEEKAFLIDTILRGYPVPEIYVYSAPAGEDLGDDAYAVVDGQQRLRACLDFLNDGFSVTFDTHKLEPLYTLADTPWFGKKFSQLDREHKERIRRYKLIVRDLEGVTDDQIRHMFHRLNQSNVALNAQELRYSMYKGGLLGVVEKLTERDEWGHFRLFTKLQQRRMLDSEFIAELVIGYLHWPQNKKDNLDNYYRQYSADFPFASDIETRFEEVLDFLLKVFPDPRMGSTRWYRKSDFYTLFLALARGRIRTEIDPADLRARLVRLSQEVSGPPILGESEPVTVYRTAVERAATDRARRIRREDALVAFIEGRKSIEPDELEADDERPVTEQDDDETVDDEEYVDR